MRKSGTKAGFILERDVNLFHFLFESKVATGEQIQRKVFSNVRNQTRERRLRKLLKSGWLSKAGHSDGKTLRHIFSLTDKAYRQYVFQEGINDRRIQLASEVIDHDLALVDIRACLEGRVAIRRYYTENQLQSCYELAEAEMFRDAAELRSDAVVELLLQEHRFIVPLEYEATLKARDRNRKKILEYYMKHEGNAVLFVCRNDMILNALSAEDCEISREYKPKLYFASLADVLNASEKLTFVSADKTKRIVL